MILIRTFRILVSERDLAADLRRTARRVHLARSKAATPAGDSANFSEVAFGSVRNMLGILACAQVLASCTPPPQLIGIDNPNFPVASVTNATTHKIYVASTRQASEAVGALYSEQRSPSLGLASVKVSIPPTHTSGQVERPKKLPPDPRTEFAVVEPTLYANETAFISALNRSLSELPYGKRDILFFVHGYNNTTSDALLRLAQFVEDSNYEGVPILFDWASAAKLTRYVYDMNSVLVARPQLEQFAEILEGSNADTYDVFAHSMGALLTMETMVDQAQRGQFDRLGRIGNVVLASPDIDMDLFRSQVKQIGMKFGRFFVLLSKDDGALSVSRRIAGGVPRLGAADMEELAGLGVVAIDLSEIDNSNSGSHAKFAGSPEVVQLLGVGLNRHGRFDSYERSTRLTDLIGGLPIRVVFN